ncbi:MAG: hypothetical protein OEQ13_06735 [Acidobacteriota bacterium]|nr:hypothetical protein [Acidobacteriota bacterium]
MDSETNGDEAERFREQASEDGAAPPGDHEREAEFVGRVEEVFRTLRGRPLVLSPSDTRQAIRWHEDGIPVHVVTGVIEDLFRRAAERPRLRPRSLTYCDDAVREAWKQVAELRAGRREVAAAAPAVDRAGAIRAAAAAVGDSSAPESARRRAIDALLELAEGRFPDGEADPVLAIEDALVSACREQLDAIERAAVRSEAEQEIAPYADAMTGDVRDRAVRRAEAKKIRQRFRLPDFSRLPVL